MDSREKETTEQNLHALAVQKQAMQQQLVEIDLALKELVHAKHAYRLVGGLMVASDVSALRAELEKKKETSEARLASFERHAEKMSAQIAKTTSP